MILSYCCVFCGSQAQSKLVHIVIPCVRRSHRQQGHYSKTTESWCLGILSANIWTFISCCYSISPTYPTQGRGGGREAWESERKQALKNMPVKRKEKGARERRLEEHGQAIGPQRMSEADQRREPQGM